ncbi:MAG: STAS domain-containing protein [Candidatus Edwardsbacteria bacterium]
MIMRTQKSSNGIIFTLSGVLHQTDFLDLEEKIQQLMYKGIFEFTLDFSKVKNLEPEGINLLVEREKRLKAYGGGLHLVGISPYLYQLFCLIGASQVFEFKINYKKKI